MANHPHNLHSGSLDPCSNALLLVEGGTWRQDAQLFAPLFVLSTAIFFVLIMFYQPFTSVKARQSQELHQILVSTIC